MTQAQIYLASTSPRRQELLRQIGVRFALLSVSVDESPLPGEAPAPMVARLALAKARAGWEQVATRNPLPVLGADTTVVVDGRIMGKPADGDAAQAMLTRVSGRCHEVFSAVALVSGDWQGVHDSRSEVCFRAMTPREIQHYCRTSEPYDKAGAYGIQGLAAVFIERLHGSYSGVMGLPLHETALLLEEAQVIFWLTAQGDR